MDKHVNTPEEMIEVIQAHIDGKQIQIQEVGKDEWLNVSVPAWNFAGYDYRIKPKPFECWVNIYESNTERNSVYTHPTKKAAEEAIENENIKRAAVHMREVIEEATSDDNPTEKPQHEYCTCKEYALQIADLNNMIMEGYEYTYLPFKFCPWCSKRVK